MAKQTQYQPNYQHQGGNQVPNPQQEPNPGYQLHLQSHPQYYQSQTYVSPYQASQRPGHLQHPPEQQHPIFHSQQHSTTSPPLFSLSHGPTKTTPDPAAQHLHQSPNRLQPQQRQGSFQENSDESLPHTYQLYASLSRDLPQYPEVFSPYPQRHRAGSTSVGTGTGYSQTSDPPPPGSAPSISIPSTSSGHARSSSLGQYSTQPLHKGLGVAFSFNGQNNGSGSGLPSYVSNQLPLPHSSSHVTERGSQASSSLPLMEYSTASSVYNMGAAGPPATPARPTLSRTSSSSSIKSDEYVYHAHSNSWSPTSHHQHHHPQSPVRPRSATTTVAATTTATSGSIVKSRKQPLKAGPTGSGATGNASGSSEVSPKRPKKHKFSPADDERLIRLKEVEHLSWKEIADQFEGRSPGALQVRYCTRLKTRTLEWSDEDILTLQETVQIYQTDRWPTVAQKLGNRFTPTACKLKYEELYTGATKK